MGKELSLGEIAGLAKDEICTSMNVWLGQMGGPRLSSDMYDIVLDRVRNAMDRAISLCIREPGATRREVRKEVVQELVDELTRKELK